MSSASTLSRRLRRALPPVLLTTILLVAVAVLGQIPYGGDSEHAVLRLSLRTVHGQIEDCRDRTEAELAALPQHMRTPSVCTEYTPIYHLEVLIDQQTVLDLAVAPGGWRGDRPLTVDQQFEVAPGAAELVIRFGPQLDPSLSGERQVASDALPRFDLERRVEFIAGRITLVLLDEATGDLVLFDR